MTSPLDEVAQCDRDDIHVHGPFLAVPVVDAHVVFVERMPIGAFTRKEWADRAAHLLEQYGLTAVPDTAAEIEEGE